MSVNVDQLLVVTKFISIILTGVFGVLSLATKYRDEKGNLTLWGRTALGGAMVSFIVAATSQSLELERARDASIRADEKTQAELDRFTQLLMQIDRAAHPIRDIRVGFELGLPRNHPELESYIMQLDHAAAEIAADFHKNGSHTPLQAASMVVIFDTYNGQRGPVIAIEGTSPLLPNKGTPADKVFSNRALSFKLYSKGVQIREVLKVGANIQPDLSFMVATNMYEYGGHLSLMYSSRTKWLRHEGTDIKAIFRKESGRLISTLDIPGSTLIVEPVNFMRQFEDNLDLRSVFFRFSEGYQFSIPDGAFRRIYRGGIPIFVYRFAET